MPSRRLFVSVLSVLALPLSLTHCGVPGTEPGGVTVRMGMQAGNDGQAKQDWVLNDGNKSPGKR